MAKVFNLKDPAAPVDAVFIGRPSKWGNPFKIGRDGNRAEVISKYRIYLSMKPKLMACLGELRGKDLICFCKPKPCHGDVLLELANPFNALPSDNAFILTDPAWHYVAYDKNAGGTPHRTEEDHYPTMSLADMKRLPVASLAAKNCALGMWVIGSHLDQALDLGRAWGFTYKTDLFTWVKTGKNDPAVRPISMGHYSRKQTEQCLLFTRGKPKRLDAGVRQLIESDQHVIFAPKREHSRKPEEQYHRIERLMDGPYVELFARQHRPGWSSWGNEVGKFHDPEVLRKLGLVDRKAVFAGVYEQMMIDPIYRVMPSEVFEASDLL